jgi:hypothetical protein
MHRFTILCLALFGCVVFSSCGKIPTAEEDQTFENFSEDFESGSLAQFYFLVADPAVNTVIVNNPVRQGANALRVTLRPEDYLNNGYRAELSIYNRCKYKTDVYYGFSFLVDTAYGDLSYNLICQWQDLPNYMAGEGWTQTPVLYASSPPVALILVDDHLELKYNPKACSNEQTETIGTYSALTKGVWVDVVLRAYWSTEDDGFLECWINGQALINPSGDDHKFYGKNLFNRQGNYFKFGQYRGSEPPAQSNAVYFDVVKVGHSYAEVAP